MKKLLLVSLCLLLLSAMQLYAQNRTITGTVTAKDDGQPMPGVTVKVSGSNTGTQTDANGKYSLSSVPNNATLTFSFIGYVSQDIVARGNGNTINAVLEVSTRQLGEVVVTGPLGIKRQAKELGYQATNITSQSLTQTHPTNFTNGLTAKVPGLVLSTVNNGVNPSTRFTLRGNRHVTGNNYALVVLNGVPISPDAVNTINPDDIESVNVLNGAGAAALYGSEASNGALIITTKRGSSTGVPEINYSNSFQLETISYFPKLQNGFGGYGGEGGEYQDPTTGFIIKPATFENQSYGPAYNGQPIQLGVPLADGTVQTYPYAALKKDPRKAFFNTGYSDQNNLSYNSGDANNNFNLTANNLYRTGIVPNDKYTRTTARVSATKTYGIFRADFTAGYTQSHTSTYGNGYDGTSLDGGRTLYSEIMNTPGWVPLTNFKNITQPFADVNTFYNSYSVNPYWTVNNSRYNSRTDALNASFNGNIKPADWVDANYRIATNFGSFQQQYTRAEVDFSPYAMSDPTGGYGNEATSYGGSSGKIPGQVQNISQFGDGSGSTGAGPQGYSRIQQDIYANFHHTFFKDFKTNLLLGNSIWQQYYKQTSNSSTNLLINGFYNIGSILGVPSTATTEAKIRQIAYFGSLNVNYKDYAFLEATLRNDHDSRLGSAYRSFWYPSVKGSFLFTDAISSLKGNRILSYGKLRASYSQVGQVNTPAYSTVPYYTATSGFPYGNIGGLTLATQLNNPNLKPELTREVEFGADLGFFNNRINASATYYDSHTRNQTLNISTSPSTGYQNAIINVGEVKNSGVELKLDIQALTKQQNKVGLNLSGNLAIQNSKVLSLYGDLKQISLGGYTTLSSQAIVGEPYPVLYGTDVVRDPQGHVVVSPTTGLPSSATSQVILGRTTPKYILGLTQNVSYKFMTLTLVSEFRTGYVIYNEGLSEATAAGISQLSASAGRQRFVFPGSVIQTGANTYVPNTSVAVNDGNIGFWDSGAWYSAASSYVASGAFWKLREATLNFDISSFVKKSKFIKRASFALTGRNLLMFRPKTNTWADPEFSFTTGNAIGINNGSQLPPTRIFGANLNLTF
ncbi:SusC/RagA family TonB-linked outer membrane protein [Mucilaginibacter robiniae]|uniref:SusC/RagA family TonB-linked outer membrane protein n=1 Tax=Mucilaginibacter robiniae TaxID=2728022 RepID=A0A7L5E4F1_9SPHI|nr:SusC/RagA family TonB-linked outer membrane protein [Mucilaginibacter robiniae]QJD96584.1 SusC/RagA family TonB-linked outer membrane protein [Mucilaginibacter robiniae]